MRVASWNVNSLRVRLDHVRQWLATAAPDVLALQETKIQDPDFPAAPLVEAGYQVVYAGQKTYNGVALLSRTPLEDVTVGIPGYEDPQRRVIAASVRGLRVVNVYVPNGSEVGSGKYAYKLAWLEALNEYVRTLLAGDLPVAVLGDFNIAPEDRDVHDPAAWAGKVLCSEPERAQLARLEAAGLVDSFRLFEQPPGSYSWWDYRQGGFRRNLGLRIDLILADRRLAPHCRAAAIDVEPRRWEQPSDHAPVTADFADPA